MDLTFYTNGNRNINKIALTFDDGPNPFWTIKILDVLDNYSVKGNFFILGKWAEKYPEIVKEIFNRSHLIGNHTYSHPREGNGDFEKAEEIIFNILGIHTNFIRAPGFRTFLCNNYLPALNGEKKIISSDVVSQDYRLNSAEIEKRINRKVQNGSIINLHDGSEKEEKLESGPREMFKALPNIIKNLGEKFEIVRLNELIM